MKTLLALLLPLALLGQTQDSSQRTNPGISSVTPQKFHGTGAPGSITGNLSGDIYDDLGPNGKSYTCLAAFGTPPPACAGTGAGNWQAGGITTPVAVASGGTGTSSTLTGLVRGGSPLTGSELSGDCATTGSNAVTCTKTSGTAFAALATTVPGTGIATWLATPTSANLLAAMTTSTGTGNVVFATSPTIVTPTIASFTNATHNHTNAAGGGTLTLAGAAFANQGTTTTVLHGNAAGNPSFGAVNLATEVIGALPFSSLGSATNTNTLTVGTGGSLIPSGSGLIHATEADALTTAPTTCMNGQSTTGIAASGNAQNCVPPFPSFNVMDPQFAGGAVAGSDARAAFVAAAKACVNAGGGNISVPNAGQAWVSSGSLPIASGCKWWKAPGAEVQLANGANSDLWQGQQLVGGVFVPLAGYPKTGTVNTSGTAVTWVSGPQFVSSMATMIINVSGTATLFTVSSVNSGTSITLSSTAGTQSGATFWLGSITTSNTGNTFTLVNGPKFDAQFIGAHMVTPGGTFQIATITSTTTGTFTAAPGAQTAVTYSMPDLITDSYAVSGEGLPIGVQNAGIVCMALCIEDGNQDNQSGAAPSKGFHVYGTGITLTGNPAEVRNFRGDGRDTDFNGIQIPSNHLYGEAAGFFWGNNLHNNGNDGSSLTWPGAVGARISGPTDVKEFERVSSNNAAQSFYIGIHAAAVQDAVSHDWGSKTGVNACVGLIEGSTYMDTGNEYEGSDVAQICLNGAAATFSGGTLFAAAGQTISAAGYWFGQQVGDPAWPNSNYQAVPGATTPLILTTATGTSGVASITVGSGANIIAGMAVWGPNLASPVVVSNTYTPGSTTVPLSAANGGTVNCVTSCNIFFTAAATSAGGYSSTSKKHLFNLAFTTYFGVQLGVYTFRNQQFSDIEDYVDLSTNGVGTMTAGAMDAFANTSNFDPFLTGLSATGACVGRWRDCPRAPQATATNGAISVSLANGIFAKTVVVTPTGNITGVTIGSGPVNNNARQPITILNNTAFTVSTSASSHWSPSLTSLGPNSTTTIYWDGNTSLWYADNPSYTATGASPTITGCGTISTQVGGALSGTFVTSTTSCTPVLTVLPPQPNGYVCFLNDRTHPFSAPVQMNLSSTTTSATFPALTTTASDVLAFSCPLGN